MTDRLGHGVTASTSGSNPLSPCSNQGAPANLPDPQSTDAPIYIDDATGIQVSESWWPGDEHDAD